MPAIRTPLVPLPDEYLADGVYISFDGYQFWLAINHHENKVVALEPETLIALLNYLLRHKVLS